MRTKNPITFLGYREFALDQGILRLEEREDEAAAIEAFMECYGITDEDEGQKAYKEWCIDQLGAYSDCC